MGIHEPQKYSGLLGECKTTVREGCAKRSFALRQQSQRSSLFRRIPLGFDGDKCGHQRKSGNMMDHRSGKMNASNCLNPMTGMSRMRTTCKRSAIASTFKVRQQNDQYISRLEIRIGDEVLNQVIRAIKFSCCLVRSA